MIATCAKCRMRFKVRRTKAGWRPYPHKRFDEHSLGGVSEVWCEGAQRDPVIRPETKYGRLVRTWVPPEGEEQ